MAIQGIHTIGQHKVPHAGIFELPVQFDRKAFASQWTAKGPAVDAQQQMQPIFGTNQGADGWQVWLYPKGHKLAGRPAEVNTAKSGSFILMFRPRELQDAVNAISGNVSKQHLIREQSGQTIAGQPITDPGMLNDERLTRGTGRSVVTEFGDTDSPGISMNQVMQTGPRVETSPAAKGSDNPSETTNQEE